MVLREASQEMVKITLLGPKGCMEESVATP